MRRILLLLLVVGACILPAAFAAPPESNQGMPPAPLPPESPPFQQPSIGPASPGLPAGAAVPVDLKTALEWTLARNPDLIAIRQNLQVSRAAWVVAQRFPASLNPTVSVDTRPWTFEKNTGQGARPLETQVTVSWAQPIELGGRTGFRSEIAHAAFTQTQWNILQAELTALVQTYRFHQAATYRREKLCVAQRLAEFNRELVKTVQRQMQANQVAAVDVAMAEVESQSTDQQVEVARQDYVSTLADLRQQIGIGEYMSTLEPAGVIEIPRGPQTGEGEYLVRTAIESRPEIHAAEAQVCASRAAVCLARADRIPIPSVGPVYEKDEAGTTYYGFAVSSPIPVLNAGRTLVFQREAEYQRDEIALEQTKQRISNQVQAALLRWRQSQQLVTRTHATLEPIKAQTTRVERLYAAGQSDLVKLLQVRQRLIQAENTELDAIWQATQAYADLLSAVGTTPLLATANAADAPALPPR